MRPLMCVLLALSLFACAGDDLRAGQEPSPGSTSSAATPTPSPAPSPTEVDEPDALAWPRPRAPLPDGVRTFAREVTRIFRRLPITVESWLAVGGPWPRTSKPDDVPPKAKELMYGALYQQRMYRELAKRPRFARRVMRRLPDRVARIVGSHVNVGRGLRRLVTPLEPPFDFRISPPDSPHMLRDLYRASQRRYGVHWSVLASLNFVESKFGRFQGPSSAGAMGPMQFMPATWDAYGNGGNAWDPRDAIPAAARYLVASGYHRDVARALYAYNHSWDYVAAVRAYARNIRRDWRNYPSYYFWQVFVITTRGDMQLTGPGARA